ncbi:GAF domain-containing protein [Ruegeria sediminis]|uniref:GAF domain-containing protein n=1 Tax=Ruegeria sediminis TaxID=2583820 RepID=A0ABY2WYU9_9RHOB|nr:GAF domain-containing protein [Ruegeria sediminis]TMV07776.1 GAF domain-containing protein [Ruegeria sediminis]
MANLNNAQAREAASREILDLVNESRGDPYPVFCAILKHASKLCNAPMGLLGVLNQQRTHIEIASHLGARTDYFDFLKENPPAFEPNQFLAAQAMQTLEVLQVEDVADATITGSEMRHRQEAVEKEGMRTILFVPMQLNGLALGCIILYRREVQAFTDREVDLVEAFASQAVTAIENARQFREVRTRLEREKALRKILHTISQSRDDEQPVFEAIVEYARRLCDAESAVLVLGKEGDACQRLAAHRGLPDHIAQMYDEQAFSMDPTTALAPRAILGRQVLNIPDMAEIPEYRAGDERFVALVRDFGARSNIVVPLILDGTGIGALFLPRGEVRPYDADEVALVESFAAQAVIAIQNVRQFSELQARLEREVATRDILEVISQNRDDDGPVFDLITRSAAILCGAPVCTLWRVENGIIHYCASYGVHGEALAETELTPAEPLADNTLTGRVFRSRAVARIDDATDESYLDYEWVRARGLKYLIGVPIFVRGEVWGSINLMWPPDRLPRDSDTQLVEGFASQAAIAIENVRQFRALEALNAELGDRVQAQVDEIERMGRLKRFLPAAVADTVISSGSEKMLSSHRALLGALFCDIRGFTAFCETAEPEETIEVLQTYHEEMGKLINAHEAGVDLRMGDGIMVLFNDPLPCDDPAGEAARLAIAMRARMVELCMQWKRLGHRLGFGVAVSLGYANIGIVGFEGRFDYTASGTPINLASRLCDEAQDGEILLSPRAAIAVEDRFLVESRGELTLKGIREPVEVFRLTGIAEA